MKTIPVTIISVVALALSGCATGYYQRGYVGYNTGYTAPSHYRSYERNYYVPGGSFSYGREYIQPSYRYEHREHEPHHDLHRDWNPPASRPEHRGNWGDRREMGMPRGGEPAQLHVEPSQHWGRVPGAHQQLPPEPHGHSFGHSYEGGHRHHGGHDD